MKKIVLLIFLVVCLASCSKSKSCYHCTFGIKLDGTTPPPQTYCGNDGPSHLFKDSAGNNLSSHCVPE